MRFSFDKRLKIDKPLGTGYLPTEPRPIKVVNTVPRENIRADEVVIKTAKTGKVTAVATVMSMYCKKDAICRALIAGTRSFLAKKWEVPISQRKLPRTEKPFSE